MIGRRIVSRVAVLVLCGFMLAGPSPALAAATPPAQPGTGPGGADYPYDDVAVERVGELPTGAWVFTPDGLDPDERNGEPVVVFLHGFAATDPALYRGWITHLARSGNLVIYPDYQPEGFLVTDQSGFVPDMLAGIRQGLAEAGVVPESVHLVGHSLGGVLGAAYLAEGPTGGLPPAASLTAITPGGCATCGTRGFGVPLGVDLRAPDGLLLHVVTGADDAVVGDGDARAIWSRLDEVPADRKRFVEVQSDGHGDPALAADHLFAQGDGSRRPIDAMDWYGLWRPLDVLIACATTGDSCDVALGTDAAALAMGAWSDGRPVALSVVIDGGRP